MKTNPRARFHLSDVLFLLIISYFGLAAPAHAYFDIGTGAFMMQMAVAFVASVWLSMKTGWIKVDRKLNPKEKTADKAAEPEAAEAESQS